MPKLKRENQEVRQPCCPRCGERLKKTFHKRNADWEEFWRCPNLQDGHGAWLMSEELGRLDMNSFFWL